MPARRALALVLALLLLGPAARTQPTTATPEALAAAIDAVLADPDLADAFWGIHVVDLATGQTLVARYEGHNFIPASNQKLLTTAAVLDALGPEYRYVTTLYLDGTRRGTVLDGHLVVRGSGDPTISDRRFTRHFPTDGDPLAVFRAWADSLRARGVLAVTGHVVGDPSVFDGPLLGPGWAWDDEPSPFAAQIAGLSFNEGRLTVTASAEAGARARLRVSPATDYVLLLNRTATTPDAPPFAVRRDPGSNVLHVEGLVPRGTSLTRRVSVHDPARFFVHVFRETLLAQGLAVEGEPLLVDDGPYRPAYAALERAATHTSPPLRDLAALTNKESQNLVAEHLLRTLGAERCAEARARAAGRGDDPRRVACGSTEAGLLAAEPLFERAGLRVDRMRLRDGSGMSPYNMVAPRDLTALLAYMWHHPDPAVRRAFVASLAVGGEDGTLRGRFGQGLARGNVRAKTGTVTGARNLAGYVTTASGRPLAFAVLTNLHGTTTRRVTEAQDRIVEALARYRG